MQFEKENQDLRLTVDKLLEQDKSLQAEKE